MTQDTTAAVRFKCIVVGTDFEPCSARAIAMAERLAKADSAQVLVVHTVEPPTYVYAGMELSALDWLGPIQDAARQSLDECVRQLTERGVRARGVLGLGSAWEQILSVAAEAKADLIVLGTHGRRGFSHALLGSVAEKVVRMAPVPVITVRGGDETQEKPTTQTSQSANTSTPRSESKDRRTA